MILTQVPGPSDLNAFSTDPLGKDIETLKIRFIYSTDWHFWHIWYSLCSLISQPSICLGSSECLAQRYKLNCCRFNPWSVLPYSIFFKSLFNCQVFSRIITNKITRIFWFSPIAKKCQKYLFLFFLWLSKNTRYASTYLYTQQFTLILFNSIKIYIDSDWIRTHASIQQALKSNTEIDWIKKYCLAGNWTQPS